MQRPGTADSPLRVAIVGSGPAGFYIVQALRQAAGVEVEIDMFDRLPTPFGLVRHGVAPDHAKIKSVTAVYHKLAKSPGFRFFGGVEYGKDLLRADLEAHYHQIVFSTGAQTDRRLGIPGEDLRGSHPATEFVAWYNAHPDFSHLSFDLDCERAIVVGVGNVAVDVARILARHPDELGSTDIADYALDALRRSAVREIWLVGRRGPTQAAFSNPEVKELGQLEGAEAVTRADEVELDALSRKHLERDGDKATARKLEILRGYAGGTGGGKAKRLVLRFLLSPVEILGDADGRVRGVRLVHNELYEDERGGLRPRATDRTETVEAGLVFRSVGYRGVALADLPFDPSRCVVPNENGRVLDPAQGNAALTGLYVSGWIKRGPSGVIGTNKPDAKETVQAMLGDLAEGRTLVPAAPAPAAVETLLRDRGVPFVSYDDWLALDAQEIARGELAGRTRLKFNDHAAFRRALNRG